ncbi:MAG: hypothetical protein KAS07_00180 [Candidatus Pacebacteria bacterium]|nr:hypothetical protein [Candidatus Paceibacterota bacterium]
MDLSTKIFLMIMLSFVFGIVGSSWRSHVIPFWKRKKQDQEKLKNMLENGSELSNIVNTLWKERLHLGGRVRKAPFGLTNHLFVLRDKMLPGMTFTIFSTPEDHAVIGRVLINTRLFGGGEISAIIERNLEQIHPSKINKLEEMAKLFKKKK